MSALNTVYIVSYRIVFSLIISRYADLHNVSENVDSKTPLNLVDRAILFTLAQRVTEWCI